MALSTDLLPTFNTSANGNKLSSKIDGIDISSHLFSPNKVLNRPAVFWQISKRYKRSGNYSKINIPRPNPIVNQIVREGHWKLCALENELTALYNIQEDPYERWNLLQSHPEKAQELHKKLKDWLNEPREKQPYQK